MRRRDLFTVGTLALAGAAATAVPAAASEPSAPKPAVPLDIAGIGLPIISEGRIRNYVFVTMRLTLAEGHTPDSLKSKVPYLRDALVRAAYRTPFVVPNDFTRINDAAVNAMLMAAAPALAGPGVVTRVEVALQSPRRRTSIRSA